MTEKGATSWRMPVTSRWKRGMYFSTETVEMIQQMNDVRRRRLVEWRRDARKRWWNASEDPFNIGCDLLSTAADEFRWTDGYLNHDMGQGSRRIEFLMPGSDLGEHARRAGFVIFAFPDFDDWGWDEGKGEGDSGSEWRPRADFYFGGCEESVVLVDELLRDEHLLRVTFAKVFADTYEDYVTGDFFPCEAELAHGEIGNKRGAWLAAESERLQRERKE